MRSNIKKILWCCAIASSLACTPSLAYISVGNQQSNANAPIVLTSHSTSKHTHKHTKTYAAPFASKIPGTGKSVFIFNPRVTQWAVYDADGNLLKTGRGSGGKKYCPDIHRACRTPSGVFQVYARGGAGCKSKKFPVGRGGAPMPYCTFFHGGYAIHGSYEVRSYNASHGCIRVHPGDAKWLQSVLPVGSTVIIKPY